LKNRRYSDLHQEDTLLGTFLHPLFHRLDPEAPALITKTQVKASVQKELSLMLNTRCVVSSFSSNPQGDEKGSELSSWAYVLPEGLGLTEEAGELSSWAYVLPEGLGLTEEAGMST